METILLNEGKNLPLIVLIHYDKPKDEFINSLKSTIKNCSNLLIVFDVNWDEDLSPWKAEKIFKNGNDFRGGADKFLESLRKLISGVVDKSLNYKPTDLAICGYSLAGLFSLYALFKADYFNSALSISGSLRYPNFDEFIKEKLVVKNPKSIYLSLGDKEKYSKNKYMKEVEVKTNLIYEEIKRSGIKTIFELNSGNHFQENELRIIKGITWYLNNLYLKK